MSINFDLEGWTRPKAKCLERLNKYDDKFYNALPTEKAELISKIRDEYQKKLRDLADEMNKKQRRINEIYAQKELDVIDGKLTELK